MYTEGDRKKESEKDRYTQKHIYTHKCKHISHEGGLKRSWAEKFI